MNSLSGKDLPLRLLGLASKAAEYADSLLGSFAEPTLEHLDSSTLRKAQEDPDYPHREDAEKESTSIYDWDTLRKRREVYDRYDTNPWWEHPLRVLANKPFSTVTSETLHAYQRLTRGWDDTATYSLDTHLAGVLGAQLIHLAETTHGWPGEETMWETPEKWEADLKRQGNRLIAYSNSWSLEAPEDFSDEAAWDGYNSREEQLMKDAQKALRWVAKNLRYLWD